MTYRRLSVRECWRGVLWYLSALFVARVPVEERPYEIEDAAQHECGHTVQLLCMDCGASISPHVMHTVETGTNSRVTLHNLSFTK